MQKLNNGENSLHSIDAREIRARLDTPAVRLLLDRGVSFDLIKETLEHRLRTTGNDLNQLIAEETLTNTHTHTLTHTHTHAYSHTHALSHTLTPKYTHYLQNYICVQCIITFICDNNNTKVIKIN